MKNTWFIFLSIIIITSYNPSSIKVAEQESVNLILDTDIGFSFDDVGAMAMLHALADSSEVKILGIASSNKYKLSVPCIEVINTYFGRRDIPIGITKNENATSVYPNTSIKWTEELVAKYSPGILNGGEVPDAVELFRKILSEADDNSITICTIGFLTNLLDLLLTPGDNYSPLTGLELVERKVKRLVTMGGSFPQGKEFNLAKDAKASQLVIGQWPGEILFSGSEIGSEVITGKSIPEMKVTNSPVKDAYEICISQSDHFTGMSWDQTAILVAVKGYEPYYTVERGLCVMAEDGSNTWKAIDEGNHMRLIPKLAPADVASIIEQYMKHLPLELH